MKKITKMQKVKIYKTVVQILFLIFLPGLITLAFSQVKELFSAIGSGNYVSIITNCTTLIILSILTILAGRIFCGWMCIFGALNDWIYIVSHDIFKTKYKVNENADKVLRYLKYVILFLIAAFVWTGIVNLPNGSSPWDAYAQISDIKYLLPEYLIGTILLILIGIGAMFIERFFCRYLCPLGAIFAILSKLKIYKVHKERSNCGACKACTLKCSMGIDLDKVDKVNSGECIQCFNCVNICPRSNAKVKVLGEEVNENALAAVAITTAVGVYSLTNVITSINSNTTNKTEIVQQNNTSINNTTGSSTTNNAASSNSTSSTTNNTKITTTPTKYKDGTYTGTGRGYRPGLKVSVTIKNDKITKIELVSSNETPGFYERAINVVPNEIIKSQSTNVNAVSGATRTSNGIMEAVDDALSQAIND